MFHFVVKDDVKRELVGPVPSWFVVEWWTDAGVGREPAHVSPLT